MKCSICKVEMAPSGATTDCGGDCRRCMAVWILDPDEMYSLILDYEAEIFQLKTKLDAINADLGA